MIQKISIKKTENYINFKKISLGNLSWVYQSSTSYGVEDYPVFVHSIVSTPGILNLFPTYCSDLHSICNLVLSEIFYENGIDVKCVFRVGLNMCLPLISDVQHSHPHYDHNFDHKNLLVYLTDSDGDTVVCEKNEVRNSPKEDTGIVFKGKHYNYLPTYNRRVVLVCTFM